MRFAHQYPRNRFLGLLALGILVTSGVPDLTAQAPKKGNAKNTAGPASSPALELLKWKSGEELRGLSLSGGPGQQAFFIVQRNWLKKQFPEFASKFLAEEQPRLQKSREELGARLESWIKGLDPNQTELKTQLEMVRKTLDDPETIKRAENSQLTLIPVNPRTMARFEPRPPAVKNAILLGFQERIEGLETRTLKELLQDLDSLGIDPTKDRANILERLPPFPCDDPTDWAARKALYSYMYGKPLLLQGSGDVLVDAGKKDPNMGAEAMLMQLLPKLLQKTIGDLTGENPGRSNDAWMAKAVLMAEASKAPVARVTRVEPDLLSKQIRIEDHLLARGDNGKWGVVWHMQYSADGTMARPHLEAVIKDDPQIAPLLKAAGALGLNGQIDEAIRFGAATMELQQRAEKSFTEFLKLSTRRLDGVPLKWLVNG